MRTCRRLGRGGAPEYRRDWYNRYLASKIQPLLDAIAELANHDDDYSAQSAFILLRHSAAHKFTHLLRSAPPSLIEEAALAYDTSMTDCLAKILDRSSRDLFSEGSSPSASTQAALPTNLGGLGLSSAQVVSLPAYLASWIDFLRFNQQRPSFLPALSAVLSPDALASSPNREIACLRSVWDDLVSAAQITLARRVEYTQMYIRLKSRFQHYASSQQLCNTNRSFTLGHFTLISIRGPHDELY